MPHPIALALRQTSAPLKNSYLTLPGPIGSDTIHVCLTSDDADLRSAAVVVRSVSLTGQILGPRIDMNTQGR